MHQLREDIAEIHHEGKQDVLLKELQSDIQRERGAAHGKEMQREKEVVIIVKGLLPLSP